MNRVKRPSVLHTHTHLSMSRVPGGPFEGPESASLCSDSRPRGGPEALPDPPGSILRLWSQSLSYKMRPTQRGATFQVLSPTLELLETTGTPTEPGPVIQPGDVLVPANVPDAGAR